MKRMKYIYALLISGLFGFVLSSCDESSIYLDEEIANEYSLSGETVKTTFTVGVKAPDVSADIDMSTRAVGDNANIDYARPENGGRFQNYIAILVGPQINTGSNRSPVYRHKIYGLETYAWYSGDKVDNVGVKETEIIFSDIEVPREYINNKEKFKVYVFGNVCHNHFKNFTTDDVKEGINTTYFEDWNTIKKYLLSTISAPDDDPFALDFTPGKGTYIISTLQVASGMPVNNSAEATVVKGNTQFTVELKRVCARLQVTFRNYTGKYIDYETGQSVDNNVYVDNFVLNNVLTTSTDYFHDGAAKPANYVPTTEGSKNFDFLTALGGASATNDHVINKIENGKDLTISMYVFENKKGTTTGAYTYDLKVDRGKSLGNRAESLQDGNVYVMWSDNLDPGSYSNNENRCLGADDEKILLFSMNDPSKIPYGTGDYGNRVFWHYNEKKFQSCKVDLRTDTCELTNKYIGKKTASIFNQPEYEMNLQSSGHAFDISHKDFEGYRRTALKVSGNSYMMISNNKLKARYITSLAGSTKPCFPWVFFAKYIIKNGVAFGDNKGALSQIERGSSYELDFSVMPNYDTKQELLVNCVRKQSEISWSETQK